MFLVFDISWRNTHFPFIERVYKKKAYQSVGEHLLQGDSVFQQPAFAKQRKR